MTYNVRDWVNARRSQIPGKVRTVEAHSNPLTDKVHELLGDVQGKLLAEHPEWAERLYEVLSNPNRFRTGRTSEVSTDTMLSTERYLKWRRECEWCGDFFIETPDKPTRFCSGSCAQAMRARDKRLATHSTVRASTQQCPPRSAPS